MFFNNKKVNFYNPKEDFSIFSLYDNELKKFYSLVLFKHSQEFLNSLCYTFDKSKENELLKIRKNELVMFRLGSFNVINGRIDSDVKFMGRFIDLINDYDKKKFKIEGEKYERESVEDTDKI